MFGWIDRAWNSVAGRIGNDISSWVHSLIRGLYSFLSLIFGPVGAAWSYLWKHVINYHDWMGRTVDEIYRALRDGYDWINNEGHEVYYYITHPAQLIDRLWDPLWAKAESEIVNVAERAGKFVIAFVLKNVGTVVRIAEDIIDAVF